MTDQDIRDLLARKSETANLDYKEGFAWTKDNRDKKYELVRDLMAMANTKDGGKILFGVQNADFGLVGVTDDIYASIDANNVVQTLHANAASKVKCAIFKRELDGKKTVVFDVAEFEDVPVICTDTIKSEDQSRTILRKGAIYIRTSAASTEEICSADEMRELLGRAMTRKGDELLRTINRLMTGKPLATETSSKELYEKEVAEGDAFFEEHLGAEAQEEGYTEVIAYPTVYQEKRIQSIPEIRGLVEKSEVSLRGWNFPHTDMDNCGAFNRGFQSFTLWDRHHEGYRLYQSGCFIWRRLYWEDIEKRRGKNGNKLVSFISLIYSFTEHLLFFRRLYEALSPEATIHIRVAFYGCKDRQLASFDSNADLWDWYVSKEDVIALEEDIKVAELQASFQEIALRMVKHVFHVFNWLDVRDDILAQWQEKLLKRKF